MNTRTQHSNGIELIAGQLREQESTLVCERRAIDTRLRQLDREIRSVRTALAALGAKADRSATDPTNGKAALTTKEVAALAVEILSRDGPADPASLRERIEQQARRLGRSLIGFHLRFANALKDPRLGNAPDGRVVLVTPEKRPELETEKS